MATYYWVPSGGSSTGNWNSTNTANWSTTSGGAGGAGPPVSGDDVVFDGNSDNGASFTVTITATGPTIRNLTISGLDQSMILAGSTGITIQGNISLLASNFTWSATGLVTMSGSTSATLTTNGVTVSSSITVNKSGGASVTLGSALTTSSTRTLTLTAGVFDAANYNVTTGNVVSSNSNTRTLTMGSGTWTIQDSGTCWNLATITNLTLNENTSVVVLTSASAKTFSGGGETYYQLKNGGAGVLTIAGSNSFNDWPPPGAAYTYRLTSGTTQTFTSFTLAGTSGNLVVIDSTTAASAATVSKSSGSVSVDYLSIKDSTATGGATWNAANSTNVSGNTGWTFGTPASVSPPVAAIALSANAPAVGSGGGAQPPVASIALSASAPAVGSGGGAQPPVASIALSANAPAVGSGGGVSPPAATISLAANAPSVSTGGASVAPPVASIALAVNAPVVGSGASSAPDAVVIAFAANAPTVASGGSVFPPVASIGFRANAPVVGDDGPTNALPRITRSASFTLAVSMTGIFDRKAA